MLHSKQIVNIKSQAINFKNLEKANHQNKRNDSFKSGPVSYNPAKMRFMSFQPQHVSSNGLRGKKLGTTDEAADQFKENPNAIGRHHSG